MNVLNEFQNKTNKKMSEKKENNGKKGYLSVPVTTIFIFHN